MISPDHFLFVPVLLGTQGNHVTRPYPKQLKKNIILEEESKQEGREVHHPEICAKSEMMLANKRDEAVPVYDRLYGISKEKRVANILLDETPTSNISLLQEEQQQENTFAP